MTAAHCFVRPGGMDPSIYTVRLGEHHLENIEGRVDYFLSLNIDGFKNSITLREDRFSKIVLKSYSLCMK